MIRFCLVLMLFTSACGKGVENYKPIYKENIRNAFDDYVGDIVTYIQRRVSESISATDFGENVLKYLNIKFDNNTITISMKRFEENSVEMRKMKQSTNNMMQYMLVPSFLMAGILPWVMPKIQMAVMAVSMMNNMVFTSALVSLVRGYIFDYEPNEHIIYINKGYRNKNKHKHSPHH